jgi:hypothetical protein
VAAAEIRGCALTAASLREIALVNVPVGILLQTPHAVAMLLDDAKVPTIRRKDLMSLLRSIHYARSASPLAPSATVKLPSQDHAALHCVVAGSTSVATVLPVNIEITPPQETMPVILSSCPLTCAGTQLLAPPSGATGPPLPPPGGSYLWRRPSSSWSQLHCGGLSLFAPGDAALRLTDDAELRRTVRYASGGNKLNTDVGGPAGATDPRFYTIAVAC